MSYAVVVARYNESIDWLRIFDAASIVIYNKGRMLGDKYKVIPMENKGLEVSAYLRYIVDNYDTLPDVVFFCQGAIHDHVFDMRRSALFEKYIDLGEKMCSQSWTIGQVDSGFEAGRLRYWNGELADAGMDVEEFFHEYVDSDPMINLRDGYKIYNAAIFSVRRELIGSRPREYYQRLLEMPALAYQRPEVAHFFERSWYYIFNCHRFSEDRLGQGK